jgi:hypothetical protein
VVLLTDVGLAKAERRKNVEIRQVFCNLSTGGRRFMTCKSSRLVTHLLAAAMLVTLIAAKPESRPRPQAQRAKAAGKPANLWANPLTVHEWGTFTAIAGRDGKPVVWRPLAGASDLPSFVYDLGGAQAGRGFRHGTCCPKASEEALVRMETPVLYFYADREATVSVRVSFPRGKITEWYPQARGAYSGDVYGGILEWGRIRVLPAAAERLPVEPRASHYYAARETDAALVRVCGKQEQHEKFLFYRAHGQTRGWPFDHQ